MILFNKYKTITNEINTIYYGKFRKLYNTFNNRQDEFEIVDTVKFNNEEYVTLSGKNYRHPYESHYMFDINLNIDKTPIFIMKSTFDIDIENINKNINFNDKYLSFISDFIMKYKNRIITNTHKYKILNTIIVNNYKNKSFKEFKHDYINNNIKFYNIIVYSSYAELTYRDGQFSLVYCPKKYLNAEYDTCGISKNRKCLYHTSKYLRNSINITRNKKFEYIYENSK